MSRDRFMFFENFMATAEMLDDKNRLAFYDALCEYVFKDIEPTDPYIAALLNAVRPSLDKTDRRGGVRQGAGAPKGNTNASKSNQETIKNNQKQSIQSKTIILSETETETESKEKEIYKEKENSTIVADLEKEELAKVKSTHNDIDWADVQDRWNRIATKYNLAKIAVITEKRKQQFKARLAEHKITVEQFFYFVNKAIGTSWFLQGSKSIFGDDGIPQLIELDNKWKANFDFCLQSQSFSRMRENFYGKDCPELLAEWELLEKGEGNADEIQTL